MARIARTIESRITDFFLGLTADEHETALRLGATLLTYRNDQPKKRAPRKAAETTPPAAGDQSL